MDNHQFNFNILLKCIVNLFTLDTWTTAQRKKFYTTCPGLYRNNIPTLRNLSGILQPEIKWRNRFGAQILPLSNVILEKASKKRQKL